MKLLINFLFLLLIPLTEAIKAIASKNPELVETYYSKGIYPWIAKILSGFSGIFPFSLMEVLLIGVILYFFYRIITLVIAFKKRQWKVRGLQCLRMVIIFISMGYFLFTVLWSLNNYRIDVADSFDLKKNDISSEELTELYEQIIIKTNGLREQVNESEIGTADSTVKDIIYQAQKGYKNLAQEYPIFKGTYGKPKPLMFSFLQTSAGYSGVYFPYTAEPNFNKQAPIFSIPHTVCHEIAHQRGFASEDEANYLGFLACKYNDDVFFQYSGYLFVLRNLRSSIYEYDPQLADSMDTKLNEGIKRDIRYSHDFWTKKVNQQFSDLADKANDAYLKSNNQEEGILNYGKVIELIFADYLKNRTI